MARVSEQKVTRDVVMQQAWDRDPNYSLLFVGTEQPVGQRGVSALVRQLAEEAKIPFDEIAISGSSAGIAKKWKIDFGAKCHGPEGLAFNRAKKVHSLLKL